MDEFSSRGILPLGMKDKVSANPSLNYRIAARSFGPRARVGRVHDENVLNLEHCRTRRAFSTVYDAARYVMMWLGGGSFGGMRVLSEAAVAAAIEECRHPASRDSGGSCVRDNFRPEETSCHGSFGHTGFTGTTSVRPRHKYRSNPSHQSCPRGREGNEHIRLRAKFANAVAASVL